MILISVSCSTLPPTTTFDASGARETNVPDIVMALPGTSVCSAIKKCEETSAVFGDPPYVRTGTCSIVVDDCAAWALSLLPMVVFSPAVANDIAVLPSIIADASWLSVCPATTIAETASDSGDEIPMGKVATWVCTCDDSNTEIGVSEVN